MKNFSFYIIMTLLVILSFRDVFGQKYNVWHPMCVPEQIQFSMDIADIDTVFILFWPTEPGRREGPSLSLPSISGAQAVWGQFTASGDMYISMLADSSTRMLDSLKTYIKTISYSKQKGAYYLIEDDSTFIDWKKESGNYVSSTVKYLAPIDQDHGYAINLTGELCGGAGVAIFFEHETIVTDDPVGATLDGFLTIWQWH